MCRFVGYAEVMQRIKKEYNPFDVYSPGSEPQSPRSIELERRALAAMLIISCFITNDITSTWLTFFVKTFKLDKQQNANKLYISGWFNRLYRCINAIRSFPKSVR